METTRELSVVPQQGMITRMGMINPTFIEDAVIVSEKEQEKEHPNFIESNTSGITLEELETNCIVPSFGDNQLTISHQTFIHRIEEAASMFFAGETFGNTEIRVSHKILGRHPSALTKRKEELKPEDETIYYQKRNRKRNIPILLNQTLQALHLKNWKRTVLYPALETTSLQSATRLLYTVLRRRQACFLQEKLSVIRKSESHIRF